jgi:hypothetical protein
MASLFWSISQSVDRLVNYLHYFLSLTNKNGAENNKSDDRSKRA